MSHLNRTARLCVLALLMIGSAGMSRLTAQNKPAQNTRAPDTPAQDRPSQEKSASSESSEQARKQSRKSRGPAQELAHETREAAGEEEDQAAELKRSPAVVFIARVTGLNLRNAFLFTALLNFVVIAAVIIWAGRKYLPGAFRDRTAAIQKAMQEAQKASDEARRRLADIESRLMKLDVEIGMMRDAAESEAAAEEARIQAAAQEDARKIIASAEQEISAAVKAARRGLTAYATDLAVALAQKQIHVDVTTDQALVKDFAGQLSAAPGEPRGNGGRESR